MPAEFTKTEWEKYCATQKEVVASLLAPLGYTLDNEQPHTLGERFLTRPLTGGRKLVWLGQSKSGDRVVIKTSDESRGMKELAEEHQSRIFLERIGFAYEAFRYPKEIFCGTLGKHQVLVTEFIEQECPFLSRPLEEQFAIALAAFKTQESAHATTYSHQKRIERYVEVIDGAGYARKTGQYAQDTIALLTKNDPNYAAYDKASEKAIQEIVGGEALLEQYSGFLTHWDFTPQNFRIRNGELYFLDHGSIRFGNKYEGWARFINFMELYNPPLAAALVTYIKDNRTPEETETLRLMRIFRLMELIRYYASWLPRTDANLRALTEARIEFWTKVLQCVLENKTVPNETVESYKQTRDSLRSEDEKKRQKGLH